MVFLPEPITTFIVTHKVAIASGLVIAGVAWEIRRLFGVIDVTIKEDEVVFVAWESKGCFITVFRQADVLRLPVATLADALRNSLDAQRRGLPPTPKKRALGAANRSKIALAKHLTRPGSQPPSLPPAARPAALLGHSK